MQPKKNLTENILICTAYLKAFLKKEVSSDLWATKYCINSSVERKMIRYEMSVQKLQPYQ